jgi:hypothetical protein
MTELVLVVGCEGSVGIKILDLRAIIRFDHNVCAGYETTSGLKNLWQILRPYNNSYILSMFAKYQTCINKLMGDYDMCVYKG